MAHVVVDVHEGGERTATVLPGRGYTCDGPLLHHLRLLLRQRGWTVRTVRWTTPPTPQELLGLAPDLLDGVRARTHLVVAKSLSTRLLPAAVERGLPGVWLTPLLREPGVRGAARSAAPALLVGGSADPHWDGDAARRSGRRVLEVEGADHSVEVPGDAAATARALRAVVAAAAGFLDDLP
ncbi:alpha/beta hydrolase [Kineococcus sp. SYSU DK004]|uniref:alpha/beta hydrolase n=1 Tax=Kineococcus sp. SYSU DK004 TaxID=3383125 RepID=UPI003D7E303E